MASTIHQSLPGSLRRGAAEIRGRPGAAMVLGASISDEFLGERGGEEILAEATAEAAAFAASAASAMPWAAAAAAAPAAAASAIPRTAALALNLAAPPPGEGVPPASLSLVIDMSPTGPHMTLSGLATDPPFAAT